MEKTSAEESDAYHGSRPLGSRVSAWASPQSRVIADRPWLEARFEDASRRFGAEVPRPEYWGGYRLLPDAIEFWQGRADRLHDRIVYSLQAGGSWRIQRLAP